MVFVLLLLLFFIVFLLSPSGGKYSRPPGLCAELSALILGALIFLIAVSAYVVQRP